MKNFPDVVLLLRFPFSFFLLRFPVDYHGSYLPWRVWWFWENYALTAEDAKNTEEGTEEISKKYTVSIFAESMVDKGEHIYLRESYC